MSSGSRTGENRPECHYADPMASLPRPIPCDCDYCNRVRYPEDHGGRGQHTMSRPDIERLARHYVTDPHDTCDPHEARELAQAFLDERAARVRVEEALRQLDAEFKSRGISVTVWPRNVIAEALAVGGNTP